MVKTLFHPVMPWNEKRQQKKPGLVATGQGVGLKASGQAPMMMMMMMMVTKVGTEALTSLGARKSYYSLHHVLKDVQNKKNHSALEYAWSSRCRMTDLNMNMWREGSWGKVQRRQSWYPFRLGMKEVKDIRRAGERRQSSKTSLHGTFRLHWKLLKSWRRWMLTSIADNNDHRKKRFD